MRLTMLSHLKMRLEQRRLCLGFVRRPGINDRGGALRTQQRLEALRAALLRVLRRRRADARPAPPRGRTLGPTNPSDTSGTPTE